MMLSLKAILLVFMGLYYLTATATNTSDAVSVAATPKWVLFWCLSDVGPGETLMCGVGLPHGSGDTHESNLTLRIAPFAGTALNTTAMLSPSNDAVTAVIPASAPAGSYSVQLFRSGSDTPLSDAYTVNAPELWWAQGDRGETATAGGWVRLFGRNLVLPTSRASTDQTDCGAACKLDSITRAMVQAGTAGDWDRVATLATNAGRLAARQRDAVDRAVPAPSTTLTLTDSDGRALVLHARGDTLSAFSAEFAVPNGTRPGNYSISLSNGHSTTKLSWFKSEVQPAKSIVEIVSPPASSPPRVVRVSDFGCRGGMQRKDPANPTRATAVDCTAAVSRALAAAAASSPPSTVLLGPGRWYVQPPLLIPDGVTLSGHSMSATALYFSQVSINGSFSKPVGIPALIGPADGEASNRSTVSFSVTDMAIYALSFYSTVINISANTANVAVQRVRIRANAFVNRNGGSRKVPWQDTVGANGPPVISLQGHGAQVTDCDIYATWIAIQSRGHYGPTSPAHSARFALIRNNTIWNGGACFWADQAKEVIFEGNRCSGVSPMSGGNGIMTYGGGYAQHVFWGGNSIRHVWGNDREVMTFDNRGNQYFGTVSSVSADGTNVSTYGRGAAFGNGNGYDVRGGALVVLNGTGAGQIRRILDFRMEDALNGSGWFTLDAPLDVPLRTSPSPVAAAADGASLIACVPFRGRSIFHANTFEDAGAHQLYGIGLDTVVAHNTAARFGGFLAWGQGRRGGYPPHTAFFANPNVRNEWVGNRVVEGLRADHQGGPINVSRSFGDASSVSGNSFVVVTAWAPSWTRGCENLGSPFASVTCRGMNRLLAFRRNVVGSNGGFQIGASTDVVLEGNRVHNTPAQSVGLNSTQSAFQISAGALGCVARANVED